MGVCTRQKLEIPRGERYEMCRSVHAEANAIIHASRADMIKGTLYLVGKEKDTGDYVENASPCAMCRRMIMNAGISNVVVRNTQDTYTTIVVLDEWINNDDSLEGVLGY